MKVYCIKHKKTKEVVNQTWYGGIMIFKIPEDAEKWIKEGGGFKNPNEVEVIPYEMELKESE